MGINNNEREWIKGWAIKVIDIEAKGGFIRKITFTIEKHDSRGTVAQAIPVDESNSLSSEIIGNSYKMDPEGLRALLRGLVIKTMEDIKTEINGGITDEMVAGILLDRMKK